MDVLPAIDLRGGKVVRLERGDYARQKTYFDEPAAVAARLVAAGASWIHMVDLDAARSGTPANTDAVRSVLSVAGVRVQLGGGMRGEATIEAMLAEGVERVVVGSAALADWAWFERLAGRADLAGRLTLALDARKGRLAVQGWTEQLAATPVEVAGRVRGWPLGAVIYTDIDRDGMLGGVNIETTAEVVAATDAPVIASGGVAGIDDVLQCKRIGCGGVIIGRAYYEGKIDLAAACAAAEDAALS